MHRRGSIKTKGVQVFAGEHLLEGVISLRVDRDTLVVEQHEVELNKAVGQITITIMLPPERRKWARKYRQESLKCPAIFIGDIFNTLHFRITGRMTRDVNILERSEVETTIQY